MLTKAVIKRPVPLSEQVSDFIAREIREGRIEPGGILPTEAELATRLEVSRTVVREAIARLKHEGLVETKKGGRSKIPIDTTGFVFRLNTEEKNIEKLYELRAIIEPEAAAMAAVRASRKQIREIKALLHRMQDAISKGQAGGEESANFHKAILFASGNPYLAQLAVWVDNKVWAFTKKIIADKDEKLRIDVDTEHARIVKAIEDHDPQTAKKIARMHVILAAERHDFSITIP